MIIKKHKGKLVIGATIYELGVHQLAISSPETGRMWQYCPHCNRLLEVDIDDYLPVHSRRSVIVIGGTTEPEDTTDLCEGSWNTKGAMAQATEDMTRNGALWVKDEDAK